MGMPFSCRCPERAKPVAERRWVVLSRQRHYSTFSTGRRHGGTYTPYSSVVCLSCRACGRTKAAYVSQLRDATPEERRS